VTESRVPVESVRISSTHNRVRVVAEDREGVEVSGDADIDRLGSQVTIGNVRQALVVRVPIGVGIIVGSTSAKVEIVGQVGDAAVITESGRVEMESARSVDIRTVSARVEVGRVEEDCRVRSDSGRVVVLACKNADVATKSGRITLGGVDGPVRAHCVSGRVEIVLTGANDVDAETVSGSVTISLPPDVVAHTTIAGSESVVVPASCDCVVNSRSVSGHIEVSSR